MGERDLAVGVRTRPDEPRPLTLRFSPSTSQPMDREADHIVFRMLLEDAGTVRALVDVPLAAGVVEGHPLAHLYAVVGTLAARQLSRLAARDRLPAGALLPLRLVGLDPHVTRLLRQPALPLDAATSWVVTA